MTVIIVHLACDATGSVDPDGPVLIKTPDGSQTGRLLPGEFELFAGDKVAQFEADLVDGTWRLIRRAGTN
jgi:hypothetical protein